MHFSTLVAVTASWGIADAARVKTMQLESHRDSATAREGLNSGTPASTVQALAQMPQSGSQFPLAIQQQAMMPQHAGFTSSGQAMQHPGMVGRSAIRSSPGQAIPSGASVVQPSRYGAVGDPYVSAQQRSALPASASTYDSTSASNAAGDSSKRAEIVYRRNGLWSFMKGTGKRIYRGFGGLGRGALNTLRLAGNATTAAAGDAAWEVAGTVGDVASAAGKNAKEAYKAQKAQFLQGLRKSAADYRKGGRSVPQQYPGCQNVPGWSNGFKDCQGIPDRVLCKTGSGFSCAGYEVLGWCAAGRPVKAWAVTPEFKNPGKACCACGGGIRRGRKPH